MRQEEFSAFALAGELELNKLAVGLKISRKYRWEEPMVLDPVTLQPATGDRTAANLVYLFYFGGVVFVNCPNEVIGTFFREMGKTVDSFRKLPEIRYRDSYSLQTEANAETTITNDYAVMPRHDVAFIDIVAFVIAKSVALERIEEQLDKVLDEIEGLIALLDRGKLNIPDRKLAKLASDILNFKYRSIAYVMVLDKPEITWEHQEADRLYMTMANLFELNQRYVQIRHKSETLLDITEVFTSLSHARRASRLEWIIIILICIEIVIYVFEIMR